MTTLADLLLYVPVELSFGTSGLRGLVTDMTDLECYINTAGFLRFLKEQQALEAGATIYVAGDLRDSTPRIITAVIAAVNDNGYVADFCGLIPTPALASYGLRQGGASIMVTGSHIPADRNGIKFYKLGGEILKDDESAIKAAVAEERNAIMNADAGMSSFDERGALTSATQLPIPAPLAATAYHERYATVFSNAPLAGKQVIVYQHSAVGRDMLADVMRMLGAEVMTVGRSDVFVPIDTENVTPQDQAYFKHVAADYPDVFAIVSTDGDSDRPFVVDEHGIFHRGDELGAVVAEWLGADFAAIPVSSSDAVDQYLSEREVNYVHTRIGSPYVIVAMQQARTEGSQKVVGWEVNGGFLLGEDTAIRDSILPALPTRDAFLPIIVALVSAAEQSKLVSEVFSALPTRYTQAGLIDGFPVEKSRLIVAQLSDDTLENRQMLERYFNADNGFGHIIKIDGLDGVRIFFDNDDIAHLRPSGNAPQMRIYSVAQTQERADEIVQLALNEPDGILRQLERAVA